MDVVWIEVALYTLVGRLQFWYKAHHSRSVSVLIADTARCEVMLEVAKVVMY